jgi:hypothetical protein
MTDRSVQNLLRLLEIRQRANRRVRRLWRRLSPTLYGLEHDQTEQDTVKPPSPSDDKPETCSA